MKKEKGVTDEAKNCRGLVRPGAARIERRAGLRWLRDWRLSRRSRPKYRDTKRSGHHATRDAHQERVFVIVLAQTMKRILDMLRQGVAEAGCACTAALLECLDDTLQRALHCHLFLLVTTRTTAIEHGSSDYMPGLGTQQAGVWKVECLEEFLSQTRALRDRLWPSALIAFNGAGAGFRRHPEAGLAGKRLFDYVDFLSDEGHEPHYESAICKAMRAHAKPFEVLTSNAIANEWVGWVTKPPSLLSLEGAIVGSHGGSFGLGLSILPDGEMPNGELGLVRETTTFLHQREAWFGPQTGLADVRILIQPFRPSSPSSRQSNPPSGHACHAVVAAIMCRRWSTTRPLPTDSGTRCGRGTWRVTSCTRTGSWEGQGMCWCCKAVLV